MSKKNEALRLAEWIESDMSCHGDAEIAAELRRLHAQRDALLGLVKRIRQWDALDIPDTDGAFWKREIDAAIKAVEEEV